MLSHMRARVPRPSLLAAGLVAACGGGGHGGGHGDLPPPSPMLHPEPWFGALTTPGIVDQNPDPDVLEVSLTATIGQAEFLPGHSTEVWTYNGTVPGPTLDTEVGTRVVVHFTNDLPEPTTIHWHGVRVPNAMDGTVRAMEPVAPGATFTYEFVVEDPGTFWYHPHVRTDDQVARGLYGAVVVRDPSEPNLDAVADELVVLSDVSLVPDTGALDDTRDARDEMMGTEGNLLLVNGARSNLGFAVRAGERRRWRVVNAAASRYVRLALEGGSLVRVASDGALLPAPDASTEVLLTPGERAELLVSVSAPGTMATLVALPYERAIGAGATEKVALVRMAASDEPLAEPAPLPDALGQVPDLAAGDMVRTLTLSERMEGDRVTFLINGASFPDVPLLSAELGSTETWNIVNDSGMDHPFHVHGFRFQASGALAWKDTLNIPAEASVQISIDFDARSGAAGGWMYHCHILGHEEGGMMGEVMVR